MKDERLDYLRRFLLAACKPRIRLYRLRLLWPSVRCCFRIEAMARIFELISPRVLCIAFERICLLLQRIYWLPRCRDDRMPRSVARSWSRESGNFPFSNLVRLHNRAQGSNSWHIRSLCSKHNILNHSSCVREPSLFQNLFRNSLAWMDNQNRHVDLQLRHACRPSLPLPQAKLDANPKFG